MEEIVSTDQLERRSEGEVASVGEKRPAENGDVGEFDVRLKRKAIDGSGDMKRVAEIVLVLSAMAEMRGGRSPTEAEVEMMEEARTKMVGICLGLAPEDIVAKEGIDAVIEDLGLNSKARDQRLGFRPPAKMSIAQKLLFTKRRMEQSKEFVAPSAPYSSQRLQTSFGAAAESRGASNTVIKFQSDKPSHAPASSGGFPNASPLGQVSAAASTSLPHQLPSNNAKSHMVSNGLPSSHLGSDSLSALPRVESAHFKLDGRARPVQASSSADHSLVNAPTWTIQTQSTSSAKSGPENKVSNQTSAKVDGTMLRMAPQATRDQTFRPFITQTTPGNLPSIHQPLQGTNFIQAPPLCNSHNEIAKLVQKLLQPQLPEHPTWTPPSRDYMTKASTCQVCKLTINDVESVLLCDACDKGYHIKCLPAYNQKGIPRNEWHCPKCLHLSNGKPLPPKYGRVMRNTNAPKVPPNSIGVHSSVEKKVGTFDQKVNQRKIIANGVSGLQKPPHLGTTGSKCNESASGSKMSNTKDMQGNNVSSDTITMNVKPLFSSGLNNSVNLSAACGPPLADSAIESSQKVPISESSACEERLVSGSNPQSPAKLSDAVGYKSDPAQVSDSSRDESSACAERLVSGSNLQSPAKLSDAVGNKSDPAQTSDGAHDVDGTGLLNCVESTNHDNNVMVKDAERSHKEENSDCNPRLETKLDSQDAAQVTPVGTFGTCTGTGERAGFSADCLHNVDWIGDVLEVVDDKTFYHSCCVDGVEYKAMNHALFRSSNGKLIPSRLQAMWEDSKTRSKWVIVNRCYFPGDLPEVVGRPCTPESNEVYESNHDSTMMAGLIQGPCDVLPPDKFKEESERRISLVTGENDGLQPIFLCKWFYDKFNGIFQPGFS